MNSVAKDKITEKFRCFFWLLFDIETKGCSISTIEISFMESQASSQSNTLPNTLVPQQPLPWPTAYQQYPFCAYPIPYFSGPSSHGCYSRHWVYPHCIHFHASSLSPPTCHKCSKILASPCNASSSTEAAFPCLSCPGKAAGNPRNTSQHSTAKFSNGSPALSNFPCRSVAKQEMPTGNASLEVKCPTVQFPVARYPPGHAFAFHPPFCSHPQFTGCPWSHGCWNASCLLSMRHCIPPRTVCPIVGPVPFPSVPPLSIPKCNHIGPELNRPDTLLTKFANGETPLHFESWQGNGKIYFQDFQDSEVQDAEQLENEDDEPIFVLTDEYAELFAKSEARRQEKKRQQRKEAKNLCRAAKFESKKQDDESKSSPA